MWTVSSNAALEVDGGISPTSARNVTITGPGPNTDGALRSVSGTNTWNGAIIPPVQSLASPTRIQVDAGTFTLAAGTHTTIAPSVSGTPLQFTALGATAVLNQPRQLTASVSDVTVNNGGVGTVVFSVANSHTGGFTVEGGTAKVTNATATSTGTVQVNATATLQSTVQSTFTTLRLGTNGSGSRAILKFAA
jgi:autotransporter family porin